MAKLTVRRTEVAKGRAKLMAVLAEASDMSDGLGLFFPAMCAGQPISENTHAKLLRELGFDAVTPGFRSSFRDYAAEQTHTPHAVMEESSWSNGVHRLGSRLC